MESPFINKKVELEDRIKDLEIQKEELNFSVINLHEQLLSLRLEEQTNRLATEVSDLEQEKTHLEKEIENFHSQTENPDESYGLDHFASNPEPETLPEFTQEDSSQPKPEYESPFYSTPINDTTFDESDSLENNGHASIDTSILSDLKSFINSSGISYDERSGKWHSPTN